MNNSNDDLEALIRRACPDGHRSELIPVTITPEMAKGYLSFGVAQSKEIDQSVIDDYALSMRDGEWKAGSILIFSEDYKIIDGYYRLAAVAQSGVPAEFYLVRGVPSNL
ncbi:hypothetical protein NDI47_25600 [Microcoleus vaginatus GB1-A2]|uniref:hypothetical protein n=1 Tax=Microcoleus vaginatus TaxID=119532 RepID=UPI001684BC1E|nr:hypothetical protein [Microcoleus sp. FACHB-61]